MNDDGVAARMGATLAALLVIDLMVALAIAVLLEPWLAPGVAATVGGGREVTYVVLTAMALCAIVWAQLRYTRQEVLAEANADPVTPESHPGLHARVTRLASLADMPVPTVAVADSRVANSFAVGDLGSGTVVVSERLLDTLDDDEIDAVLAHEIAHLKNRDALVMTLATFLPALVADEYSPFDEWPEGTATLVWSGAVVTCYVLSSAFVDAPLVSLAGIVQFAVAAGATVIVGGVVVGLLAAAAVILGRSLSRRREFLADRAGARLVGNPAALATALATLDGTASTPEADARARNPGLAALCLLPHGLGGESVDDEAFTVEVRSHPPTEERIERLRELAATLETKGPGARSGA